MTLDPRLEHAGQQIVDSAITVHRSLGPGLLEVVYQTCFVHELKKRGLKVAEQLNVPLMKQGIKRLIR